MNATREYTRIICNAKYEQYIGKRKKGNGVYYERHHIVPKCIKKDDSASNLVLLTAKEHFLCHQYLCDIYKNTEYSWKMYCAFKFMAHGNKNKFTEPLSADDYQLLKDKIRETRGTRHHTNEHRKKIGDGNRGKVTKESTKVLMRKPKPDGFGKRITEAKTGKPNIGKRLICARKRLELNDYDSTPRKRFNCKKFGNTKESDLELVKILDRKFYDEYISRG